MLSKKVQKDVVTSILGDFIKVKVYISYMQEIDDVTEILFNDEDMLGFLTKDSGCWVPKCEIEKVVFINENKIK